MLDSSWQRWARASLVPTVTGRVVLRLQRCPALPRAAGCVYRRRRRTIYIRPGVRQARSVLLHELGHLFDLRVMNNSDRGRFRRIVRAPRRKWWAGKVPFAEAYSFCARYRRIVSIGRYASYDYGPSRRQHRSVCALIVAPASKPKPKPTPTPTSTPRPAPTVPPVPTIIPLP